MEYTKGEWIADNGDSELWGVFEGGNGAEIAYLGDINYGVINQYNRNFDENKANAHLIAAAPDMYEALKSLEGYGRKYPCGVPFRDKIKIALAKAEGKGE